MLLQHRGVILLLPVQRQTPVPIALDPGGNHPEAHGGARLVLFVRRPAAHVPQVGHDARPGFGLRENLGAQQPLQLREEPHEDDVHIAQIGIEHVAPEEAHASGHPLGFGAFVGLLHQLGVDIDTPAAHRGVQLGGAYDDAAVARAEIGHHVAVPQLGELQHALDVFRGAADERREHFLPVGSERGAAGRRRAPGAQRDATQRSSPWRSAAFASRPGRAARHRRRARRSRPRPPARAGPCRRAPSRARRGTASRFPPGRSSP